MATTTLTKADEKQLDKFAEIVNAGKLSAVDSWLKIGEALKGARDLTAAAGCKGRFSGWVEEHCGFDRSTAYRYIAMFEQFGNCRTMLRFQDGTIPRLAMSPPACREAKELAKNGKIITPEVAKSLLKKHKKFKPEPPAKAPAASPESSPPLAPTGAGTSQDSPGAAADYSCPNCGGMEADKDGDCAKCKEPSREPGDDTAALAAECAKRRASGKETVPPKLRKEALKALGVVVRFIDRLKRHDEARPHLEAITAIVKGTA